MAQKNPFAIPLHQRTAAFCADPVCDRRTEITAHRSGKRHHQQMEAPQINQVAGERHDEFRRDWNAR